MTSERATAGNHEDNRCQPAASEHERDGDDIGAAALDDEVSNGNGSEQERDDDDGDNDELEAKRENDDSDGDDVAREFSDLVNLKGCSICRAELVKAEVHSGLALMNKALFGAEHMPHLTSAQAVRFDEPQVIVDLFLLDQRHGVYRRKLVYGDYLDVL